MDESISSYLRPENVALALSIVALLISILRLAHGRLSERRALTLRLVGKHALAKQMLADLADAPETLKASWRAAYAAKGMPNSGAQQLSDEEFDAAATEHREINDDFEAISTNVRWRTIAAIELEIRRLYYLQERLNSLGRKLERRRREHYDEVIRRREETYAKFRNDQLVSVLKPPGR